MGCMARCPPPCDLKLHLALVCCAAPQECCRLCDDASNSSDAYCFRDQVHAMARGMHFSHICSQLQPQLYEVLAAIVAVASIIKDVLRRASFE